MGLGDFPEKFRLYEKEPWRGRGLRVMPVDNFPAGNEPVGYATNMDLVNHYCNVFKAEHIAMLHPFKIAIYEEEATELREVHDYEWTDEEI